MTDERARGLLSQIDGPQDVKNLRFDQLPALAAEIRCQLIATVSRTGGHLASNLGAVELTIALHRVFESPADRIVFDVGHQCYTHKLLTGRRGRFQTLRQAGGLSGYPKRAESEHDAFIAGHSSTSVSAAIGLARAKKLRGEPGKAVAVIGDGAFSGIVFEALNNIDASLDNLVVVLNDNEMSISKNLTTFSRHLAKIRNSSGYYQFKDGFESAVRRIPFVGTGLRDSISLMKSAAKNLLYHSNLFEDMGFTYLGPADGHDFEQLCSSFARARSLHGPVLVHVHTKKGRGFKQAEENPGAFHGVSRFDPHKRQDNAFSTDSFSEQAGLAILELAKRDPDIVAVTAAMKYATGLHHFSARFREEGRFFDVGIAESHAVIFASALAVGGLRPVFCVYSSFLQRSYDQLLHDCSLDPTHVVLGVDRAGLVGEDGETHQGLFDVPYLTSLPGAAVYSPASYGALKKDLYRAFYEEAGLVAVRYPRGKETFSPPAACCEGRDYTVLGGQGDCLAVTYGRIAAQVLEALDLYKGALSYRMLLLDRIYPIPEGAVMEAMASRKVVFVEEGARSGGIGEKLGALLQEGGYRGLYVNRAVDWPVVPQGTLEECMKMVGLDAASIAASL